MLETSLQKYTDELMLKVQNGQIEEAIEHCRHILSHYPMYLPAYRLIGYASLEKGDYAHATHFFQSVLSADPEDADAWLNLATLSDDLGELEQSTWLMERAFEVEPGNAEIRDRLRHLYSRRDGIERTRIKLTPGALGRLYARGGFYRRAIEELERVLAGADALPPLHVAYLEASLAKALWNAEGMVPLADRVCSSLLEKLPNCLQANLVMGQIRRSAGLEDKATPYLEVAQALDPEGRVAQAIFGDQSPIPFRDVTIPYLERETAEPVAQEAQAGVRGIDDTSWLDHVGEAFQAGASVAATPDESVETSPPEWLQEWSAGTPDQPTPPTPGPDAETIPPEGSPAEGQLASPDMPRQAQPAEGEEQPSEPTVPDWLQSVEAESEDMPQADALEGTPLGEADVPPVSAAIGGLAVAGAAAAADELPDWLRSLDEQAEDLEEPGPPEPSVAEAFLQAPDGEEEPDWLRALSAGELGPEPAETGVPRDAPDRVDMPTELRLPDLVIDETGERLPETPTEVFEGELPEWLDGLQSDEAGVTVGDREEAPQPLDVPGRTRLPDLVIDAQGERVQEDTDEPSEEQELPDWLLEISEEPEAEPSPGAQETLIAPASETSDWLAELEPEAEALAEAPAEQLVEEEIPDWLQDLRTEGPESIAAEEPATPEPAAEPADWLAELEPEAEALAEAPAEQLAEEEIPDWLQELRTEQPEPLAAEEAATPEPAAEPADWLAELEPEAEALAEAPAEQLAEEEIPDWLQELRTEQPEPLAAEEMAAPEPAAESPEWLAEPGPEAEALAEAPAEQLAEEEIPDWLQELRTEQPEPLAAEEMAAPEPAAESADWLAELEPEVEAPAEAPAEQLAEEELPDWLQELRTEQPEPLAAEEMAAPEPTAESADWLAELEREAEAPAEAPAEQLAEEELPDWLQELRTEQPEPLATEEMAALEPTAESADWLAELEREVEPPAEAPAEQLAEEETPDWLQELSTEQPEPIVAEESALAEPIAELEPDSEAPAGAPAGPLVEVSPPPPAAEESVVASPDAEPVREAPAPPSDDADLPDWLQALRPKTGPLVGLGVAAAAAAEHTAEIVPAEAVQADERAEVVAPPAAEPIEMPPRVEGMPVWLTTLEDEIRGQLQVDVPLAPSQASLPAETVAVEEPLRETQTPEVMAPTEAAPDWLTALETEVRVPTEPEPVQPVGAPVVTVSETPSPAAPALPPPVESMPPWLTTLEDEIAGRETVGAKEATPPSVAQKPAVVVPQSTAEAPVAEPTERDLFEPAAGVEAEPVAFDEGLPPGPEAGAGITHREETRLPPGIELGSLPQPDEEEPEWLGGLEAAQVTEVTVEEMPSWLDDLRAPDAVDTAIESAPLEAWEEQEIEWLRDHEEVPELIETEQEIPTWRAVVESQVTPPIDKLDQADAAQAAQLAEAPPSAGQTIDGARSRLEAGALDDAARAYEALVGDPALAEDVIRDLEGAVAANPDHHALQRVLGDAYMQNGELTKALEAYQRALTKL